MNTRDAAIRAYGSTASSGSERPLSETTNKEARTCRGQGLCRSPVLRISLWTRKGPTGALNHQAILSLSTFYRASNATCRFEYLGFTPKETDRSTPVPLAVRAGIRRLCE